MYRRTSPNFPLCGCWFVFQCNGRNDRQYLPQVQLDSHTTILATTSRTTLRQTFSNPSDIPISKATYTFPLYDGVSVAGFTCTVGGRVIAGVVKEKTQAKAEYQEAVDRGEVAGLLEQNIDAADVFTTSIGNVPARGEVLIEITYIGELKVDGETDGAQFTIPTKIAPRYGESTLKPKGGIQTKTSGGIQITVDVMLERGSAIRGISSPSHPIAITMGSISGNTQSGDDSFENNLGSATLALGSTELDKDFVVVVMAKGQDTPRALLESHPTIPNQRALMTTLVPKFNIPNEKPEVVFVVDRSGSMGGKMNLVVEALKVFVKSLPVSVKFNICSFGSHFTFLFDKSRTYDATSLQEAMDHITHQSFSANYGGTEMMQPVKAVLERRYKDLPLEVMLLTDGEIWNQEALFQVVNEASAQNARFFTLGIGSQASSSLVEGIARAGRGFSQWVYDGERIDKRIVRMLKGALSPHIKYKLEVKYRQDLSDDDDFEMVESFEKSLKMVCQDGAKNEQPAEKPKKISLFDATFKDEPTNPAAGKYDHLPLLSVPNVLQTPQQLPELFPHSRSTVYLLLGAEAHNRTPEAIILRGSSKHGDLELEIPVQDIGQGETIHQLATKKATQELEEGRGWLTEAFAANGKTLQSQNEANWDLIVEREAVRLGTAFQVANRFCSFVAVEKRKDSTQGQPPSYERSQNYGSTEKEELSEEDCDLESSVQRRRKESSPVQQVYGTPMANLEMPRANLDGAVHKAKRSNGVSASLSSFLPLSGRRSSGDNFSRSARKSFGIQNSSPAPVRSSVPGSAGGVLKSLSAQPAPAALSAPPPPPARGPKLGRLLGRSKTKMERNEVDAQLAGPVSGQMDPMSISPAAPAGGAMFRSSRARSPPKVEDLSPLEKMQQLIALQTFMGSWSMTEEFLKIVSHGATRSFANSAAVQEAVKGSQADQSHSDWVDGLELEECATVLAVVWLQMVMKDENDVWEMVVEKAQAFLDNHVGGSDRVNQLLDGARGLWKV